MDISSIRKSWKNLIASDSVPELLQILDGQLNFQSADTYNVFLQLKSRYIKWYRDDMNGLLSVDDKNLIIQKIKFDFINFIESQ